MMRWEAVGCAPPASVLLPRFRRWWNTLMMRRQRSLGGREEERRCFGMGWNGTPLQSSGSRDLH